MKLNLKNITDEVRTVLLPNHLPALLLLLISLTLGTQQIHADTLTVAVASNFAETLEAIAEEFERDQSHKLILVRGSSGRHFAQVVNGAPFDLFFSADSTRVQRLVTDGVVPKERVRPYAIGQLALWAPGMDLAANIEAKLKSIGFNRLSIANPRLAPYGQAANEVLESLGLTGVIEAQKIITGENVAQAFQFVASGNVEMGFVALSQVIVDRENQYWKVPQELYRPITQELAVIKESVASKAFLDYLDGTKARNIILQHGYRLPPEN